MSKTMERIRVIGEEAAREFGFELVLVQLVKERGQWILRFVLDKPGGIGIADCERFSRRVEPLVEAVDPVPHSYILEVSSAGLDRPLLRPEDYRRFAGRTIDLRLYEPVEGRRRFSAKLLGLMEEAEGPAAALETADGYRLTVPLGKIAMARLVPEL
ncbi:MAG: ribosome maturation factor RimP [Firmicutes bacterium]|nr:ribosome maturation factor RimP [Bacillota bacterium]